MKPLADPIKAVDLYRVISLELHPWLLQHNLHRLKDSRSGWFSPVGSRFFLMTLSHAKNASPDHFVGSQFRVDVGMADQPLRSSAVFRNVALYLEETQLRQLLEIQNRIITELPYPSLYQHHAGEHVHSKIQSWYLRKFEPVTAFEERLDNVFLRYRSKEDAKKWAAFLQANLPIVIDRFKSGKPALWD